MPCTLKRLGGTGVRLGVCRAVFRFQSSSSARCACTRVGVGRSLAKPFRCARGVSGRVPVSGSWAEGTITFHSVAHNPRTPQGPQGPRMGLSVVAAAAFGTVGRLYTVSADYMADAGRPASWNRYTYAEFWPDPDDDREDGQHPKVLLVHPDLPDDVDVDIDIEPGAIGIVPDHLRHTGLYTAIAGAVVPAGSPENHSAQLAKGVRPKGPKGPKLQLCRTWRIYYALYTWNMSFY